MARDSYDGRGGGAYAAYGEPGTFQNQPGISDFGKDSGGAYHSGNIYNPDLTAARKALLEEWAQLQQQYPQYTNHAKLNFSDSMPSPIAGQGGHGNIWINNQILPHLMPDDARRILAKELGQAVQDRMIPNNATGDKLMNLWGYGTPQANGQRWDGLPYGAWQPGSDFTKLPGAISVGGYKSYPADVYGIQFAAALGLNGNMNAGDHLLSGPALAYAQARGMVPTKYAPPTTPQQPQPNVSDFGRGINRAPMPAVLPAQVNNPAFQAMQQRAAQQNSANLAMRGGPRNF